MVVLSELSAKNPEASEPYSQDDAQPDKNPRKDEDIEKQFVQKQAFVDRNLLIQREIPRVLNPRQDPLGGVGIYGLCLLALFVALYTRPVPSALPAPAPTEAQVA